MGWEPLRLAFLHDGGVVVVIDPPCRVETRVRGGGGLVRLAFRHDSGVVVVIDTPPLVSKHEREVVLGWEPLLLVF